MPGVSSLLFLFICLFNQEAPTPVTLPTPPLSLRGCCLSASLDLFPCAVTTACISLVNDDACIPGRRSCSDTQPLTALPVLPPAGDPVLPHLERFPAVPALHLHTGAPQPQHLRAHLPAVCVAGGGGGAELQPRLQHRQGNTRSLHCAAFSVFVISC